MTQPILEIKNLKKYFPIRKGILRKHVGDVKAVDDISFAIEKGQTVGLVGESGSGKTTAARAIMRLIEPTDGQIFFLEENFREVHGKKLRRLRQKIQMIFQNPLSSLNPRKTILENIGDALLYHRHVKTRDEQVEKVLKILEQISIDPNAINQYPHQFSGGQQQRISIARSIALQPKLIICDEAVSALDVSARSQILNLLVELQSLYQLSYLFISHDLSVVHSFSDYILVMYKGKIVESGVKDKIFEDPKHPYTQKLLSSLPKKHPREKKSSPFKKTS